MKKLNLQYTWWRYVLVLAVAAVLWTAVFSALEKPGDNEKLDICYYGTGADADKIHTLLNQEFSQPLKAVSFSEGTTQGAALYTSVQTGIYVSDVLVFQQGVLTDAYLKGHFPALPKGHFEELTLYEIDGVAYGIVLNPADTVTRFSRHYTEETLCVAFFSPESVNTGGLFGKGNAGDRAAVEAVYYLAEEITP